MQRHGGCAATGAALALRGAACARLALLLVLLGTPSGCARKTRAPATETAATAGDVWLRGTVRYEGSRGFWRPCDGGAEALLVDPTGTMRQMVTLVSGGQGSAYAEIAAIEGDAPDSSVAGGRRPARMVTAINRITPLGEGGDCDRAPGDFLFRASGNEPFWAVDVRGDSIVFSQPDAPARIAWPAPGVVAHDDVRSWTCAGPPALHLEITSRLCSDGMSGATSSWSAVATLNGRTLKGCAYQGLRAAAPVARQEVTR